MTSTNFPAEAGEKIRRNLARWFRRHGRNLPWRRTQDPYAVLVSEFMLQQTTVAAVIPYFERWLVRFPTVRDLAEAPEHDVLLIWQGLGYYSRARNLHRAAQAIMTDFGGVVPTSREELRTLSGVGDYTAAAVAAFSFDAVEVVIDANIARVLARLLDWREPIDDAAGKAFLSTAAASLLPCSGGRLHTSALMELGALVCTARAPRCEDCPVRAECRATRPESLPIKRPRKPIEMVEEARAFVWHRGQLWLEPSAGPRWRGMWMMPVAAPSQPGERPAHVEIYPITRYKVTMMVFEESPAGRPLSGFSPDNLPPMPSPHRRAVAAMLRKRHSESNHVSR